MSDNRQNEKSSARIPLKPSTFERFRDFCRGLGLTYDEAIEFLLANESEPGDDLMLVGRQLREALPTKPKSPPTSQRQRLPQHNATGRSFSKSQQVGRPEPVLEDIEE